jgi:predicted nucleic acid-binding protein
MTYLLDTNVCVQYLRGRNSSVLQRLRNTPTQDVHLCSVVKAELLLGALRSAKPDENWAKVIAFLQPYESLPFDDEAALIQDRMADQPSGKPSVHGAGVLDSALPSLPGTSLRLRTSFHRRMVPS